MDDGGDERGMRERGMREGDERTARSSMEALPLPVAR